MSNLWLPGISAGPIDEFVGALHRHIERFATEKEVEKPHVEVELVDGARYVLDSLTAQPGFGFITIRQHKRDEDDPDEIVVPVGSIRRIELKHTAEHAPAFGFSLPHPG
ncbi:MAG: hypothetical protein WD981_05810 [Gaiellaceae bacterium]